MNSKNWCKLQDIIKDLKSLAGVKRTQQGRYLVAELEKILDSESGDDEKPTRDDW